jgi:antirestriction protein ArdC
MKDHRQSLYAEVTQRIIAELEEGRLPWLQPWNASRCDFTMPGNAVTGRGYSEIDVLILWAAGVEQGFTLQRWLTYRQAEQAGGHVRRGEKGTIVCYTDRFTPRDEADKAQSEDREARKVAFLKRFTVFNLDQCEELPDALTGPQISLDPILAVEAADTVMRASGADLRICGREAYYYSPGA